MPSPKEAAFTAGVALRLREIRVDHKLTQAQAAEIAKLSERQYKDYELGAGRVSLWPMANLARHYRVSLDQLIPKS